MREATGRHRFSRTLLVATLLFLSLVPSSSSQAVETGKVVREVASSGPGGVEFRDDCLSGFLLSQLKGNAITWRNTPAITKLSGTCTEVGSRGNDLGNNNSFTGIYGLSIAGSSTSISCPNDYAAIGTTVFNTPGPIYVAGLKLICGKLPFGTEAMSTKTLGQETSSSEELRCPAKSLISGVRAKYGEIVDSFGIICTRIAQVLQNNLTNVVLEPTEQIYPYSAAISVKSFVGGSGTGDVSVVRAVGVEADQICAVKDGVLTSNKSGSCQLTIQKAGDDFYAPISTTLPFTFRKAPQQLSITSIGAPGLSEGLSGSLAPVVSGNLGSGILSFTVKDGTATNCQLSDATSNATISAITPGTCILTASITEDENYEAAVSPEFAINFQGLATENKEGTQMRGDVVLETYDPVADSQNVVDIQVAAFALLALATSAGSALLPSSTSTSVTKSSTGRREDERDNSDPASGNEDQDSESSDGDDGDNNRESGDVASASANRLSSIKRSGGIGDNSRLWRITHTPKLEKRFTGWVESSSAFSPVLARIFHDGSYLRAMFSGIALLPHLAAIVLAIAMVRDTGFHAIPAGTTLLIAGLGLSVIDAFAGLLLAAIVTIVTCLSGNVTTLDEAMTMVGIAGLLVTPGLLAGSVRPLRRLVSDASSRWERLTDYFLAILLGGWGIEKLVSALNGLAGVELPIATEARRIGILVSIFIALRLFLEDIAAHLFPERLARQDVIMAAPKASQPWFALIIKTTIFFAVSYQFLGLNNQLMWGTAVFVLPQILALSLKKTSLPKSGFIGTLLPKGAPKLIIMVFIGGFFANWMKSQFADPAEFLTWSFVLLAIPGLLLALLNLFAGNLDRDWKSGRLGRLIYRVGGVIVAGLILAMYQGVDLYALALGK